MEPLEERRVLATFVVDTILDGNDGDFSAGNFSLREAIAQANATAGADNIDFDAALSGATIALTGGELSITETVTIDGDLDNDGTPNVTINAAQQSRIFTIDDGSRTPNQTVVIEGLTLTGGRVTDDGGAILNRENLTLNDSIITNNSTSGRNNDGGAVSNGNGGLTLNRSTLSNNLTSGDNSEGGGIYNVTGAVVINQSTIANNSTTLANSEGGGIFTVNGSVALTDSTLTGNSTVGNNGEGGGIFNQNSSLTVTSSTISGNTTSGVGSEGGGIYTDTELTTVLGLISNSTISGNTSSAAGGGIYNFDGLLQIRNSTITANTASGLAGGVASFGDNNTTTRIVSTIIAANSSSDVDLVEGSINSFESEGNNLIGTGTSLGAFAGTGDITGVADPGLLPLGSNGGLTQTHELQADSPARDLGSNPDNLGVDQRGADRSQANTDIGAFELALTILVDTLEDTIDGDFSPGDRSLREALLFVADGGTIPFDSSLSGQTITLAGSELVIDKSVTIDGDINNDNFPDITIDADQQSRIFNVDDSTGSRLSVVLDGLIINNGSVADDGGAILNRENLTLINSRVADNSTRGVNSDGGGIFNNRGNLTVNSSTFSNNSTSGAGSDGGAIYSQNGNVDIDQSSFSGNFTQSLNSEGGAIFNSSGSLTIDRSTFTGNSTTGRNSEGGAIYSQEASLTIDNSNINGNFTTGLGSEGGGVYSDTDLSNPIGRISNSTVTGNSSSADGGGIYNFDGLLQVTNTHVSSNCTQGLGGGIASFGDGVTFTEVASSVVEGNANSDVDFVLLTTNSFVSQGNNRVGSGNAVGAFNAPGDVVTGNQTTAVVAGTGVLSGGPLSPGLNTLVLDSSVPDGVALLYRGTQVSTGGCSLSTVQGVTFSTGFTDAEPVGFAEVDEQGNATFALFLDDSQLGQTLQYQAIQILPTVVQSQVVNLPVGGVPLLAAGGEGPGAEAIAPEELTAVVDEAIARWAETGISSSQVTELRSLQVDLVDLSQGTLGASQGDTIWMDSNGAGYGWFVDPSPADDIEFPNQVTDSEFTSEPGTSSGERMDLLTAVMHEMGHALDLSDQSADSHNLLAQTLSTGTRRLPLSGVQILADGDTGFEAIGEWGQGGLGDYLYHSPGSGDEVARWTFEVDEPGVYQVAVTWVAHENRASNAPYRVLDGATDRGQFQVNQQSTPDDINDFGRGWEVLNEFEIHGSQLIVELSDNGNGSIIADDIRIERVADLPADDGNGNPSADDSPDGEPKEDPTPSIPAVQQLSESDSGFDANGDWAPGGLGNYLYNRPGNGSEKARWTFTVEPGIHRVAATWVAHENRAPNAPYRILDGTSDRGLTRVDQRNDPRGTRDNGRDWQTLREVEVHGDQLIIELSDNGNGSIIADDIRIERLGDLPTDGPPQDDGPVDPPTAEIPAIQQLTEGGNGFEANGEWAQGGLGDYLYNRPGDGTEKARWTFTVEPGVHRVAATWVSHENRANNAPFRVLDGLAERGATRVDQQQDPNGWHNLGQFEIQGDQLIVELSDDGNGSIIADDIRIERIADLPDGNPPSGTTDVQRKSAGGDGFTASGDWAQGGLGDYLYHRPGDGNETARWTFTVEPGTYRVAAAWVSHENRAGNAPYQIFDGTLDRGLVRVDQRNAPAGLRDDGRDWQILRDVQISGDQLIVELSDDGDGSIIADSIRIQKL